MAMMAVLQKVDKLMVRQTNLEEVMNLIATNLIENGKLKQ